MIYIGIDPGTSSGSISAIWDDGQPALGYCKLDGTERDIADYLLGFDTTQMKAVLEKVGPMPKQGVSSVFKFGQSYGFLRGLLIGLKIPFVEATPQKWQKAMSCMTKGDKNVSKQRAQQLWPTMKIIHRNADSLLIAEYGRKYGWS